jgi:hypothetical protein
MAPSAVSVPVAAFVASSTCINDNGSNTIAGHANTLVD